MNSTMSRNNKIKALALGAGLALLVLGIALTVTAQNGGAPKYKFDRTWPKPLPNKWKMGGVTGLAVDKDDNVWVYDRPNDLTDIELEAELNPPIADCCVRPPSMIHIDKEGNVIGSFDPPQGHGMAVDSKGFVYLGNAVNGMDNVRKYDPKTGKLLCRIAPRAGDAAGRRRWRCRRRRPTSRATAAQGRSRDSSGQLGGAARRRPDAAVSGSGGGD